MTTQLETGPAGEKNQTREEWIDYLRGIGIILMIIGHTSVWQPVIRWIFGFHMPLFFMLSGFLFNQRKWSAAGFRRFFSARVRNYIVPYFIWCGICFVINIPQLCYVYRGDNMPLAMVQNLGWIITSVRADGLFLPQNCTPLWFLTCLFLSQLVFYRLARCRPVWQCVLSGAFIALNYALNLFNVPVLPWHPEVALVGSVFMLAGYHIREKRLIEKVRKTYIVMIMFVAASAVILAMDNITDMYYRKYGDDLILSAVCSVMMGYSFMWLCRSMKTLYLKSIVCRLGVYSIIAIGLNYSVIQYVRGVCQIVRIATGMNLNWIEYPLAVLNIAVCLLAIHIYRILESKDRRFGALIGK